MKMELIDETLIEIDLNAKDQKEVITAFADILSKDNRIGDQLKFLSDVYKREAEMPTSMGFGVAIPHAQSKHVAVTSLVFLKLKHAITWGEDDNIQVIFGIAVPYEKRNENHLKILSQLARKLMDDEFREGLLKLKTKEEAYAFLNFLNMSI